MSDYKKIDDLLDEDKNFMGGLAGAFKNDELCLHYQPRFNVLNNQATVLEALVRWQRPKVGLLYPEIFLEIAEKHLLNYQLDQWVFEKCCQDLIMFRDSFHENIKVAVNFSIRSCESVYMSQKLIDICASYGLLLSDFIFELVDSSQAYDARKVRVFCETLTNNGAHICLDDFGTGKVPLIYLEHLPVQSLKIDRLLIANIGTSKKSETIIKHLLNLAHELDIISIAVGVENQGQYDFLKLLSCKEIQGFYTGQPVMSGQLTRNMLKI